MFHANSADELLRQTTTDNLTGLANRTLFLDHLHHSLVTAKQEGRYLGVLMIDMDGLKFINDHYGHQVGDAALKELAKRIVMETHQSDTVARLGGDEFAIDLPAIENRESVNRMMQQISNRCEQPFLFNDQPLKTGASVGMARWGSIRYSS